MVAMFAFRLTFLKWEHDLTLEEPSDYKMLFQSIEDCLSKPDPAPENLRQSFLLRLPHSFSFILTAGNGHIYRCAAQATLFLGVCLHVVCYYAMRAVGQCQILPFCLGLLPSLRLRWCKLLM